MRDVASVLDTEAVAVVTGGASGFGLSVSRRLVAAGISVAVLDISRDELRSAEQELSIGPGKFLSIRCDVTKTEDCEAAAAAVAAGFPNQGVGLLFNNAGIMGKHTGQIISGPMEDWQATFSVNVFGAVNILKAFVPAMIARGPLPSGKKSHVVTTSSVVGLLNHNLGPYSCSKMAVTAVCEQFAIELEDKGAEASHIIPHSLHPTVAASNFLAGRGADGAKTRDSAFVGALSKVGWSTPDAIVDGLFTGLDEGRSYIVVDHELDVPTAEQVKMRMEDQITGRRPRKPRQLGVLLPPGSRALVERKSKLAARSKL